MDELTECSIWDAQTHQERVNIVKKKVRKVYCGRPIHVKFRMRNPLLTDVDVSNL
jgi:hypothetical protein